MNIENSHILKDEKKFLKIFKVIHKYMNCKISDKKITKIYIDTKGIIKVENKSGYCKECFDKNGASKLFVTEEIRSKKRERMIGKNNHMYGNTHTLEAKKKISLAHLGKTNWRRGEQIVPILHSETVLAQIKEARRKKAYQVRNTTKNGKFKKGCKAWNQGKTSYYSASEELKNKRKENAKIFWSSPKGLARKKSIKSLKMGIFSDPILSEIQYYLNISRIGKNNLSEKGRKKLSLTHKGKQVSLETRKKLSKVRKGMYGGKNNPMWRGGTTKDPYGEEFNNELKNKIRNYYEYSCQLCGNKGATCHHIDYDKFNNKLENLMLLCVSCHGKTNTREDKRVGWTIMFQDMKLNEKGVYSIETQQQSYARL